jgi:hypothetical protein
MRALTLARAKVAAPTEDHEAYQVHRWTRQRGSILNPSEPLNAAELPVCALCGKDVSTGVEVAFRRKGTSFRGRRFMYVHRTCLKPMKTYFEEGP